MALSPRRIAIFCGSTYGAREDYRAAARELGAALAKIQITMIYGGGAIGLMGDLANSVLAGGGKVIGVMPREVSDAEVPYDGMTELIRVDTVADRKLMMQSMADGFIALPGGFGTLDELAAVIAGARVGLHDKPIALLNTIQFFDSFLRHIDHMIAEKFSKSTHTKNLFVDDKPGIILEWMCSCWASNER